MEVNTVEIRAQDHIVPRFQVHPLLLYKPIGGKEGDCISCTMNTLQIVISDAENTDQPVFGCPQEPGTIYSYVQILATRTMK